MCIDVFDRQRITYEPKWTIALIDLSLDDKIAVEGCDIVFFITVIIVYYTCKFLNTIFSFCCSISFSLTLSIRVSVVCNLYFCPHVESLAALMGFFLLVCEAATCSAVPCSCACAACGGNV